MMMASTGGSPRRGSCRREREADGARGKIAVNAGGMTVETGFQTRPIYPHFIPLGNLNGAPPAAAIGNDFVSLCGKEPLVRRGPGLYLGQIWPAASVLDQACLDASLRTALIEGGKSPTGTSSGSSAKARQTSNSSPS